jgi:hypothetical protein
MDPFSKIIVYDRLMVIPHTSKRTLIQRYWFASYEICCVAGHNKNTTYGTQEDAYNNYYFLFAHAKAEPLSLGDTSERVEFLRRILLLQQFSVAGAYLFPAFYVFATKGEGNSTDYCS